jgi:hypothetical protein
MTKELEKGHQEAKVKGVKKPYVKPAFRYEQVFETMALSCGKAEEEWRHCHIVLKRS